jgi:aspartate ammonia-lyase
MNDRMSQMRQKNTRTEHDLLGDLEVPTAAYYGAHTARAVLNFPISAVPISSYPSFITALAIVKEAAATANLGLGLLSETKPPRSSPPARKSAAAHCTTNSSSTSSRVARAPRPT